MGWYWLGGSAYPICPLVECEVTTEANTPPKQYILGIMHTANNKKKKKHTRRGPVVGHSLWTRPARVQSPWEARIIRCENLALYIRDCESLCLSDETVKAVGPFYLGSMPGEVKDPTQGVNV